jgi:hypothetical protein
MKRIVKIFALALIFIAVPFCFNFNKAARVQTGNQCRENIFLAFVEGLYSKADLQKAGLDEKILYKALVGYYNLRAENQLSDKDLLTIVDFRKASDQDRMYVIDIEHHKLLYKTLVAHGRNSGDKYANTFSNKVNSLMSSIGFYITSYAYRAACGPALALDGIEKGINDKVRERGIIIHGADYVSHAFAEKIGRIGRSWGCPALPNNVLIPVINTIAEKTCMFIYYPDKEYEQHSKYTKEAPAINEFFRERQLGML